MDKQVFDLITKLDSKIDAKFEKVEDKLGEYNNTLGRLTATVEHHVKRSDQHEEHLKRQDSKIDEIGDEVEGLKSHVEQAKPIVENIGAVTKTFKLIFSTRTLKWLIAICGVVSAFYGMKYAARNYQVFKNSTPEYKAKSK